MFLLYSQRSKFTRGVIRPGQIDLIRRKYQEKLMFLRQYYSKRTFYLRNDHVLIRLLTTGLGSLNTDYDRFVGSHTDRTDSLIRHFQFTGAASFGKIWDGEFYGQDSYEIIIGDDGDFDLQYALDNWKTLTPIKVLTHPVSDLGLCVPNGKTNHLIEGLSVIHINLPMLFLQYRLFIEDQKRKQIMEGGEGIISPKLFLYRYALPGMMLSHVDHVFVNRMINRYEGRPMSVQLLRSPFFQAEAGNQEGSGLLNMIDNAQDEILHKLKTSNVHFDQALESIFTVSEETALDLLVMPDIARTRQIWWSFLLARLKHTKFLLQLEKERNMGMDRTYKNRAVFDLTRLLNSNVLEQTLPKELMENIVREVEDTIELAKV